VKPSKTVSITELWAEPYASVVCYPRATTVEIEERIAELKNLYIYAVEFGGKASAHTLPVLGKGYVGIVVTAYVGVEKYALKMQRVDSDRENLKREAELLVLANTVYVGPKFFAVSNHFMLMQLIEGDLLEIWLGNHRNVGLVRKVLADILEQCWRMDEISLDHGELSKAPKHLLVDKNNKPFILDFETASTQRNASNVTSVCQFLFQGNSNVCKAIEAKLGQRDREKLVVALKSYKKNRDRQNFEDLLDFCLH
jgi:putative serine/threonine protein kinase